MSIEQRIYDSKNTYYQSLYESQPSWHEGEHTIWPWVSYLANILPDGTTRSQFSQLDEDYSVNQPNLI